MIKISYITLNQNKYFNVPYPNSDNKSANIKTSGCGVVSMAMILINLLGVDISVKTMAKYSIDHGARASSGTNMKILTKAIVSDYHNLVYSTTNSEDELKKHLEAGGMAIMNSDGNDGCTGIFAYGGHYLAILGIKNGKPIIADPAWTSTRYKTAYRKKYITELGNNCITCEWSTLNLDTKYRSPNYYLFTNTSPKSNKTTEVDKVTTEITYKTIDDVPSYYKDAIKAAMTLGLIKGTAEGIINVTEDVCRLYTGLYRAKDLNLYNSLEELPYGKDEVDFLIKKGIIKGASKDKLDLTDEELTAALFTARAIKYIESK